MKNVLHLRLLGVGGSQLFEKLFRTHLFEKFENIPSNSTLLYKLDLISQFTIIIISHCVSEFQILQLSIRCYMIYIKLLLVSYVKSFVPHP